MTGRLGYGRLGDFRLGSDAAVAGTVAVVVAVPAVQVAVTVSGTPTVAVVVSVPAVHVPVTVSGTLTWSGMPVIVELPATSVPVTVGVSVGIRMSVEIPAASVPVTVSASVGMRTSVAVPAVAVRVTVRASTYETPHAVPYVRPQTPIALEFAEVDISTVTLVGFTFDSTLSAVPSASVTVVDTEGIVPWPPGTAPVPELVITVGGTDLFSGPLTSADREWVSSSVWRYTLRAEGWQRNLAKSPVNWLNTTTDIVGPEGQITTSAAIKAPIKLGDAIADFWTGPEIEVELPSGDLTGSFVVSDQQLDSVLAMAAAKIGNGFWWLDGEKVLHLHAGFEAGYTEALPEDIAAFHLCTVPESGGIVPTILRDNWDGSTLLQGVHVAGQTAWTNRSYGTGPADMGWETTQATLGGPMLPAEAWVEMSGMMYMEGRYDWKRTLSATLPPGSPFPLDTPFPRLGKVLRIAYDPIETGYQLIRAVRGNLLVPGEGADGIEWTLDLGDSERRSYVIDPAREMAALPEVKLQATNLECSQVSDMGKNSTQYIYAWPEDDRGNRIRIGEGTVEWTITLKNVGGSERAIGAGDEGSGWWIADRHTDLVLTVDKKSSYAYCLLHCGDNAAVGDAVTLSAELVTA